MSKSWPFMDKCIEIGEFLYCEYTKEENRKEKDPYSGKIRSSEGCGGLMLEWIKETMYGLIIKDHIEIFNSTYNILLEKGNIEEKNKYVYGDIDVGVWIEPCEDKKVIASTRYCSCADDNTHLYILKGRRYTKEETKYKDLSTIEFMCRTVWPKAKYTKYDWGDDRRIIIPSINTYRSRNFEYFYSDGRDKGHVFVYNEHFGAKCKDAHWNEKGILIALQFLRWHFETLKNYDENKCY